MAVIPALSLMDLRENPSLGFGKNEAMVVSRDWIRFSLSLRERAGVRGRDHPN